MRDKSLAEQVEDPTYHYIPDTPLNPSEQSKHGKAIGSDARKRQLPKLHLWEHTLHIFMHMQRIYPVKIHRLKFQKNGNCTQVMHFRMHLGEKRRRVFPTRTNGHCQKSRKYGMICM